MNATGGVRLDNNKLAVDAIKKADNHNANEKLILNFLCNKQPMGEKTSSSWCELGSFIENFEPKWSHVKELEEGTRLTPVKLRRSLETLVERGYIAVNKIDKKFGKRKKFLENEIVPKENIYSITSLVFTEYRDSDATLQKSA